MHMHTTLSDGKMTPEETKAEYKEKGYSIVAFSDHEALIPHPELADGEFLPLTSYEISVNERGRTGQERRTYHLNLFAPVMNTRTSACFNDSCIFTPHIREAMPREAYSIRPIEREYSTDCVNKLIAAANAEGFLVSYNHPFWSVQNYTDYIGLRGLWGIEVYNTGCYRVGYPDTFVPVDDMAKAGQRVFPLATDDAHQLADCFGGFLMVNAPRLEYADVMQSLRNGDFYASTGPEIKEMVYEDGYLHVLTSPCAHIDLNTERRYARFRTGPFGTTVQGATFDLREYMADCEKYGGNKFIRLSVYDGAGRVAYTRPYFIDELTK